MIAAGLAGASVEDAAPGGDDPWCAALFQADPADLYLQPLGMVADSAPGSVPFLGGPIGFERWVLTRRGPDGAGHGWTVTNDRLARALDSAPGPVRARLQAAARACAAPLPAWAGLDLSTPRVMGILNVTPDSFSDGGRHADTHAAIACGIRLAEEGADIVDVGGESTRPGAMPVPPDEEARRVLPVIEGLARAGLRVSIDSRHPDVMAAALAGGAAIVNDVSGLSDPAARAVVARAHASAVIMHMQGEPQTMQVAPRYNDAALDVHDRLAGAVAVAEDAGIPRADLLVDPGIGFGKDSAHNVLILDRLALLAGIGCGILVGVSRKGLIARLAGPAPPEARLGGSIALALAAIERGARLLRVHDVAATVQAIRCWTALHGASPVTAGADSGNDGASRDGYGRRT